MGWKLNTLDRTKKAINVECLEEIVAHVDYFVLFRPRKLLLQGKDYKLSFSNKANTEAELCRRTKNG